MKPQVTGLGLLRFRLSAEQRYFVASPPMPLLSLGGVYRMSGSARSRRVTGPEAGVDLLARHRIRSPRCVDSLPEEARCVTGIALPVDAGCGVR